MGKYRYLVAALGTLTTMEAGATYVFTDSSDREQLFCDMQQIQVKFAGEVASYAANGLCKFMRGTAGVSNSQTKESTFDNFNNATELYRFTWTATGSYNATNKTTLEEIVAPPPAVDQATPANRPYGRYKLDMICDRDPWLDEAFSRCTQPRVTATGNLPAEVQQALRFTGKPFTAHMNATQRQALRRQFDERQAMLNSIGRDVRTAATPLTRAGTAPAPSTSSTTRVGSSLGTTTPATSSISRAGSTIAAPAPSSSNTYESALAAQAAIAARNRQTASASKFAGESIAPAASAPTPSAPAPSAPAAQPAATPPAQVAVAQPRIVIPAAGQPVGPGQLHLRVMAPAETAPRNAEVEFAWVAPRNPGEPRPATTVARWNVPMHQLNAGTQVPPSSGPTGSGRWQTRVRLASAAAAPWSEPVVFDYMAAVDARAAASGGSNPLERQGLNPQPLPPKESTTAATSKLDQQSLNPQPLPPKESKGNAYGRQGTKGNEAERQGLNPQPLPPKETARSSTQVEQRALNPQPLPPKEAD